MSRHELSLLVWQDFRIASGLSLASRFCQVGQDGSGRNIRKMDFGLVSNQRELSDGIAVGDVSISTSSTNAMSAVSIYRPRRWKIYSNTYTSSTSWSSQRDVHD
ncbi:hypothetical protein K435DRAFT_801118 [Dendrothele bispora CBS 962.96]|uniref:Uncharacterized protein n=1 Tax=Dendrothele bispora (strain CBS 962.96) TaxID=1314807 RepID=A0A4S8LQF7_DENBC|nr:hypothetical protein K435DRAFT_801118 [Dendrothele bispora CBS 962.96]